MTEQDAFEMACCEMWRGPLDKRSDGRYFNGHLQARWIVWQACAACKDAEIAELKAQREQLRDAIFRVSGAAGWVEPASELSRELCAAVACAIRSVDHIEPVATGAQQ